MKMRRNFNCMEIFAFLNLNIFVELTVIHMKLYMYFKRHASVLLKNVTQGHQKVSYQNLMAFKNGKISKSTDFGKFQKPRT